ncbi:uncharacterized protein PG986_013131 [Apiospora aurea]|uniref:Uncharacterized protein n=1 Tax=Apiospora aurea TaxID=335848 RepID=A0ABR1PV08_9PEZI
MGNQKKIGLARMIDRDGFIIEQPEEAQFNGALLEQWSDEQAIMNAVMESGCEVKNQVKPSMRLNKFEKFTECCVELFKAAMQRKDQWRTCKSEPEFWLAIKQSLDWARRVDVEVEAIMATVDLLVESRRRFLRESLYLPKGSLLSAWVQGWIEVIDSPDHKKQETVESLDLKQEDSQATSGEEMEDVSAEGPHEDDQKDE